jgi:hypothetical protein
MSSIRQIINKAFREAGIVEVGESPEGAEFQEGLEALQDLYITFFGNEVGEPLEDFFATDLTEGRIVPVNYRLVLNDTSPTEIKLTEYPQPGARLAIIDHLRDLSAYPLTVDANGRSFEGDDIGTIATAGINRQWFYRDDIATWVRINDLDADDESPLPPEFDLLMITALAVRLNPRYGAETSQVTTELLNRARNQFAARYKQSREKPSELGLLNLTGRLYRGSNFDRGETFYWGR